MKKWTISLIIPLLSTALLADENVSTDTNLSSKAQTEKHLKEQMKREEQFAKTQSFAQGDDYNLTEHQVDPKDIENIQVDPPMYDFNMDDVYD